MFLEAWFHKGSNYCVLYGKQEGVLDVILNPLMYKLMLCN